MKHPFLILLTISLLAACAPGMGNPLPVETARVADSHEPLNSDEPQFSNPNEPGGIPTDDDPMNPKFENTSPRDGDDALNRGTVYLDTIDLLTMESYPLQFSLALSGNLPTPCHQLRVRVNPPDTENRILVEVYSLTAPDVMCIQVLQPFAQTIPLGSFPAGHYSLWVNGEQVAELDT